MSTTLTEPTHHEAAPKGWYARYRDRYSRLPSGVQMIGLQLWLPLVFVIAFCLCYVYAFHAPAPHDMPVAIVGSDSASSQFAEQLQQGSGGTLSVSLEPSIEQAKHDVMDGTLAAAYVPGDGSAQLIIAGSAQFQLATATQATFQTVAATQGLPLEVVDLSPLPAHDAYGTSLFYLTLAWTIAGYMVAMFVGMMGATLARRLRFGIILGCGVVSSLISTILVRFPIGAVGGHFWAIFGIGLATTVAVGLFVNGLAYFFGRFVTGVALLIFVFANVPASGGAFPPEFVPEPFRWLHPYVSGTGTIDLLRSVVYGVGPGVGAGLLVLGSYAAIGLLLAWVGKPYLARRTAHRMSRGAPPSMMVAAQMSAMKHAQAAQAGQHEAVEPVDENGLESVQAREREEEETRESQYAAEEVAADAVAAVTGAEIPD